MEPDLRRIILVFGAVVILTLVTVYLLRVTAYWSFQDKNEPIQAADGDEEKPPMPKVGEWAEDTPAPAGTYEKSASTIAFLLNGFYSRDAASVVKSETADVLMTPDGKLATEVVYLEPVIPISEEKNGWIQVELSAQRGYRGYISAHELAQLELGGVNGLSVVRRANTWSIDSADGREVRLLPRGTILPVINRLGTDIQVRTLEGVVWVDAENLTELDPLSDSIDVEKIIASAREMIGLPYLWGGTSDEHFDCSGFVYLVYRMNGLLLKRDCDIQFADASGAKIEADALKPGDLVFTANSRRIPSHVGIYAGNDSIIHASVRFGVIEEKIEDGAFHRYEITGYRRFVPTSDSGD
ncbi:C40 family peptidase [bacterium]|nr:C40 family peptidase [bacterium]